MARQGMDRFTPTTVFAGAAAQASLSPRSRHAAVSSTVDLRVLELLTAHLCHELSAPIAAISNGLELLAEEDRDPGPTSGTSFVREAAALIGDSARRAGRRLQFYRFAYGFGGGTLAGPAPHELAVSFFAESRIACDYSDNVRNLPPDWQKLACNLLPVGGETLPRGGRLVLTDDPLNLEAVGEAVRHRGAAVGVRLVRLQTLGELNGVRPGLGFAHHAKLLAAAEDGLNAIAHDLVVVDE